MIPEWSEPKRNARAVKAGHHGKPKRGFVMVAG